MNKYGPTVVANFIHYDKSSYNVELRNYAAQHAGNLTNKLNHELHISEVN